MIQHPEIKIKQIRELKNFTQEYVATKLNLSIRAYSKIETGETQLTINRLNEIGECLWYLNPFKPNCSSVFPSNGSGTFHTRFGNHCFYRPTAKYKDT